MTLITGLAGGALNLLWGVLVMRDCPRRWWVILTLGVTTFVLLSQTVILWTVRGAGESLDRRPVAVVTVMLAFTFVSLKQLVFSSTTVQTHRA